MSTFTEIQTNPENGLTVTLQSMYDLELSSLSNPAFVAKIKSLFKNECLACLPGAIWNYVRKNFRYVSDSPYDEIVRAPHILMQEKIGDCDDFALFIKTCLDIIGGWNSSYLILGQNPNAFTHIIVFANRGRLNNKYVDPVYIDGVNPEFNKIASKYRFYKHIIFE